VVVAIKAEKTLGVGNRVLGLFQIFNASRQAGPWGKPRTALRAGGGDETQIMI